MKTFNPAGGVRVYEATCGLFVAVTWLGASTVMLVELVFVESFWLVAVTVTLVFCVTAGAVKFPVGSTVAPEVPLTDHMTSVAPIESTAESWIVWVEKRIALEGVTVKVTGAGGAEELQPAKKSIRAMDTTVENGIRFIIHPKWEAEAGADIPVKCEIAQSVAQEKSTTKWKLRIRPAYSFASNGNIGI